MRAGPIVVILGVAASAVACSDKARPQRVEAKLSAQASVRAARAPRPPPPAPPPPRAADGTYSVGGLHYFEFVTGGAKPDERLPLVLLLHGIGGTPESLMKSFSTYTGRARFVAPLGFDPEGHGYSWFPVIAHNYNTPTQVPGEIRASDRVAAGLVAIAKVRPTVGRFIAAGFSQGAGLTYALALRHPDLFAATCSMTGQVPEAMFSKSHPTGARPEVHGFHGDRDPVSHLADAQRTIATFKRLGYSAELKILPGVGHDFEPGKELMFGCVDKGVKAATAATASAAP